AALLYRYVRRIQRGNHSLLLRPRPVRSRANTRPCCRPRQLHRLRPRRSGGRKPASREPGDPSRRERTVNRILQGGLGWRISFPRTWEFDDGKIEAVGKQGRVVAVVGGAAAAKRSGHSSVLSAESDLRAVVLCLAQRAAKA